MILICWQVDSKETTINANIRVLESKSAKTRINSEGKSDYYKIKCAKLIGGQPPDNLKDFDEATWAKSLIDYRNWDSIEFRDPVSVFQLLPEDLRLLERKFFIQILKIVIIL